MRRADRLGCATARRQATISNPTKRQTVWLILDQPFIGPLLLLLLLHLAPEDCLTDTRTDVQTNTHISTSTVQRTVKHNTENLQKINSILKTHLSSEIDIASGQE